jgi:hypothetical protein
MASLDSRKPVFGRMLAIAAIFLVTLLYLAHMFVKGGSTELKLTVYLGVLFILFIGFAGPLIFLYHRDRGCRLVKRPWQKMMFGLKGLSLLAFGMLAIFSPMAKNVCLLLGILAYFILWVLSSWPIEKKKMSEEDDLNMIEWLFPVGGDEKP